MLRTFLRVDRTVFVKGVIILLGALIVVTFGWDRNPEALRANSVATSDFVVKLVLGGIVILLASWIAWRRGARSGETPNEPTQRPSAGSYASQVVFGLPGSAVGLGIGLACGLGVLLGLYGGITSSENFYVLVAPLALLAVSIALGGPFLATILVWPRRSLVVAWLALGVSWVASTSEDLSPFADRHAASFLFGVLSGFALREAWRKRARIGVEDRDRYVEKYSPGRFFRSLALVVLALLIALPTLIALPDGIGLDPVGFSPLSRVALVLVCGILAVRGVSLMVPRYGGSWFALALAVVAHRTGAGNSLPLLMVLAAFALAFEAFELAKPWGLSTRVVASRLGVGALAGLFSVASLAKVPSYASFEAAVLAIEPASTLLGALAGAVWAGSAALFASLVFLPAVSAVPPLLVASLCWTREGGAIGQVPTPASAPSAARWLAWPSLVFLFGSGLLTAFFYVTRLLRDWMV